MVQKFKKTISTHAAYIVGMWDLIKIKKKK